MTQQEAPFYLTKKGESGILKIMAVPDGPRYIRVKRGSGYHRMRRITLYHAYHSNFEAAGNWARVDLEGEIKRLKRELEQATQELDKLWMLRESDCSSPEDRQKERHSGYGV